MSGIRLELANPNEYPSIPDYVGRHLVPVVTELHRVVNELMEPGSSSMEESSVDMVPRVPTTAAFGTLDTHYRPSPKSVVFDGASYFQIPKELLRSKQLKVLFDGVVFTGKPGQATFRLMREDGCIVSGSEFTTDSLADSHFARWLPFGEAEDRVLPRKTTYFIQGKGLMPVCRRFALSFVYL